MCVVVFSFVLTALLSLIHGSKVFELFGTFDGLGSGVWHFYCDTQWTSFEAVLKKIIFVHVGDHTIPVPYMVRWDLKSY